MGGEDGNFQESLNNYLGGDQTDTAEINAERNRAEQGLRQAAFQNTRQPQGDFVSKKEFDELKASNAEMAKKLGLIDEIKPHLERIKTDTDYLYEDKYRRDIDKEIDRLKANPKIGHLVDSAEIYKFINAAARDEHNPRIVTASEALKLMYADKAWDEAYEQKQKQNKVLDTSIASSIPKISAAEQAWAQKIANVQDPEARKFMMQRMIAEELGE